MTSNPKIGIICPVYGYPGFLPELAHSLLEQKTSIPFLAVLIDDCCPDPETIELCTEYASAYPDIFHYIRPSTNRGLSGVRNMGIDYLLSHYSAIEGITFVDADDRLFPLFIERCYKALHEATSIHDDAETKVGWVFEDPYMIGVPGLMRRLRKHSLLWNLVGATQTSSSIFSAELFRSELRYAEDMKHGGEDWEFSIRAYKSGFRAYYKRALGLRYRRRPGSMSSDVAATLGMDRNRVDIRLRHPELYRIGPVTAQYSKECPHYCVITETGAIRITPSLSEPGDRVTLSRLLQMLSDNAAIPGIPVPQLFLFAHSTFIDLIKRNKRLLDFAATANLHGKNKKILRHELIGGKYPLEDDIIQYHYQRPERDMTFANSSVGAISMSQEGFLLLLNKTDPKTALENSEILPWFSAPADSAFFANAPEIVEKTLEKARHAWPNGIRPAYRHKEQAWRPSGMNWRDLPSRLTGLKHTFPEHSNRHKALIVTPGEHLCDYRCVDELHGFANSLLNAGTVVNLALGLIGSATLPKKTAALFTDVYLLPDADPPGSPNYWLNEQHLVSVASSYGCVVSLGTTRLNSHSPILLHNGVQLFHKLYKRSRDFEHGRSLISMFKAYKGFICNEERERQWLISHGVPTEIVVSDKQFYSVMEDMIY